jgi:3'-phosphoadenosine 5'-phosphosulfate sulfotransferase (PAPS reductase)/FAD synthetase
LEKRKQSLSHEDFLELRTRSALIPPARIEHAVSKAVQAIRTIAAGKRSAYGWSGGKDSAVIRFLCERSGVPECVLGISDLEYPAFLRWVTAHMPPRLEVIKNAALNLDWLAANPRMLFPQTANIAANWFNRVQHHAQNVFTRKHHLELLILGRRRAEGNFVGYSGNSYSKDGVEILSPIADWSHTLLFAVIQTHQLPLPPFYKWPRGFRCGTHPWPARQWCRSIEDGWREIHAIDPAIVHFAAAKIESAQAYLTCRKSA